MNRPATDPSARPHAYILAGGRSSRFGSDKARAEVEGKPLLLRIADALLPLTARITAVAEREDKYLDLGVRTIADLHPGLGPMGGLSTALSDLPDDQTWLLLLSCDLVEVRAHWIETLMLAADAPPAEAVAIHGRRWEPLFALYHRSIHGKVESRLRSGTLAMQGLLDTLNTIRLPPPGDWPTLNQVNTQADLHRYLRSRH